ncbi:hypothetical protein MMC09_002612 [Bachmanniomyces sp. S44760]|nr:hypothetical protein [Bachmanniomyces sp. S44760]
MCEKFEKVPAKTDDDVGPNWTLCLYSVFSLTQKRCIVSLIAFAAWFSTLSSFIYFPAIPLLASDLRVSIEKIDLTVTSYLVISGLAPSIIGEYADHVGRRPVIMVVLLIYVVTNVGLALQTSFEALFVLRMLQSAGISGAFSIAYGVVADLASPAERGSFVGIASFGTNTAPSLGPLLGGLLAAHFGWRAIFWFLSIASAACLLAIIFALPETLRNIVGNGSLRATSVNRLPFPKMYALNDLERSSLSRNSRLQLPNPFTCIRVLLRRDTAIVVFTLGVLYTLYSCLQASLATLFIGLYDLTELQAGLIYLPFGLGCAMAAYFTGRLLDRDYRLTADVNGLPISRSGGDDLAKFPIEAARLRSLFYPLSIAIAAIAGYGWTVQAETVRLMYPSDAPNAKFVSILPYLW